MSDEMATDVAQSILADFKGAGYYKDRRVMADFLRQRFTPSVDADPSARTAQDILADREGAGYYRDPGVLADFLRSRFGGPRASGDASPTPRLSP